MLCFIVGQWTESYRM